jgi:hypothetical protein
VGDQTTDCTGAEVVCCTSTCAGDDSFDCCNGSQTNHLECFGGQLGCLPGFTKQPKGSCGWEDAGGSDAEPDTSLPDDGGDSTLCTSTGGTVVSDLCCQSTGNFPNSCLIGACGCAPNYSHYVNACSCPSTKCYDPVQGCK